MTSLRDIRNIIRWHTGQSRWLLVHIPKNAGVSMKRSPLFGRGLLPADPYFLKSRDYRDAVAATMAAAGEHPGFQHARWRDIHPRVTGRLDAVGFVRNPWQRTLSRWNYGRLAVRTGRLPESYLAPTFEGFLEERHLYGHLPYYWHRAIRGWYPQRDYVVDEGGSRRVDLFRIEQLDTDMQGYFGFAGKVGRNNRSASATPWRDHYTDRLIGIVADWYKDDIDYFGFDVDTPATRNVWATDGPVPKPPPAAATSSDRGLSA